MTMLGLEPAPRLPRVPRWAIVIGIAWLALVVATGLGFAGSNGPVQCHLRRFVGVPCPTCGSTRAGLALLRGDVGTALSSNPLVVVAGLVGAGVLLLRATTARRVVVRWTPRRRAVVTTAIVLVVLANWAWVIARHA